MIAETLRCRPPLGETAVLVALESWRLGWYTTGVLRTSPTGLTSLLACQRVVAAPHPDGFVVASVACAASAVVDSMLATPAVRAGCLDRVG